MDKISFAGTGITDISRQPYPEPCRDCSREYLNGEHVEWRVPTNEVNINRLVWTGCVDCFLKRTDPNNLMLRVERDPLV